MNLIDMNSDVIPQKSLSVRANNILFNMMDLPMGIELRDGGWVKQTVAAAVLRGDLAKMRNCGKVTFKEISEAAGVKVVKKPKLFLKTAVLEQWIKDARYVYSGEVPTLRQRLRAEGANGCLNYLEALMHRDGYKA